MKMRNLDQKQKQNQNQSEGGLHSREQEVKHLKEEELGTESQRTSTSCLNM
jgi:hypothetical protein